MNDRSTSLLIPPAPVVALVAWLIPGGGHFLLGQRARGLTIGITVVVLFVLGMLIGGVRVVDAPDLTGGGRVVARVLQKPWFLGQMLTGPIGLITAWISAAVGGEPFKARLGEIGTLYTAIAGMLNLLAIIDSSHRAGALSKR